MKTRKVFLFLAASLLVGALAFGAFQSVYAQDGGPGDFDPFGCNDNTNWWYHTCYWDTVICNEASGNMEAAGFPFDPNSIPVPIEQAAAMVGLTMPNATPDGME